MSVFALKPGGAFSEAVRLNLGHVVIVVWDLEQKLHQFELVR